jgi:hypothetical protein
MLHSSGHNLIPGCIDAILDEKETAHVFNRGMIIVETKIKKKRILKI